MRLISLNWNYNKGEGSVSYSKIFNEAHIVVQLDMLQDCIADLTDKYAALLTPSSIGAKNTKEEHMTCPDRQWVGLTNEEIEQLSIDAGIITWVKRVYDDVDKKFYDLPLGEGMEGDGISLKQFANLVSTRLKEKNT